MRSSILFLLSGSMLYRFSVQNEAKATSEYMSSFFSLPFSKTFCKDGYARCFVRTFANKLAAKDLEFVDELVTAFCAHSSEPTKSPRPRRMYLLELVHNSEDDLGSRTLDTST